MSYMTFLIFVVGGGSVIVCFVLLIVLKKFFSDLSTKKLYIVFAVISVLIVLNIAQFASNPPKKDVGTIMYLQSIGHARQSLASIEFSKDTETNQINYSKTLAHLDFASFAYNWSEFYKKDTEFDTKLKELTKLLDKKENFEKGIQNKVALIRTLEKIEFAPYDLKNSETLSQLIDVFK